MINRLPTQLAPLDIAEVDDVPFDFSAVLQPGETIAAAQVDVTLERGPADDGAAALASGQPAIGRLGPDAAFVPDPSGPVVLQRLAAAGRPVRSLYCVRCTTQLSSGRALTAAAHISIRRI